MRNRAALKFHLIFILINDLTSLLINDSYFLSLILEESMYIIYNVLSRNV
jgi:hypothetical protein